MAGSWQALQVWEIGHIRRTVADLVVPVLAIEASYRGVEVDRRPLDGSQAIQIACAQIDAAQDRAPGGVPEFVPETGIGQWVEGDVDHLSNHIPRWIRADDGQHQIRPLLQTPHRQG